MAYVEVDIDIYDLDRCDIAYAVDPADLLPFWDEEEYVEAAIDKMSAGDMARVLAQHGEYAKELLATLTKAIEELG